MIKMKTAIVIGATSGIGREVARRFVATDILNPQHHYPMMMTVEEAAGHILRGLKRKRRVILFDWRYRILVAFWRLIPKWLWERLDIHSN